MPTIIIKHVTGVYKVNEKDNFDDYQQTIKECLQGIKSCLIVTDKDNINTFYPAELLRNSMIRFIPDEVDEMDDDIEAERN